jgi:hypothetical protein
MFRTHCISLLYFVLVVLVTGCYEPTKQPVVNSKKKPFLFKETIITGKDTGMYKQSGFRKTNIADMLCQHWEMGEYWKDLSSNDLRELDLFKDSTVLKNARGHVRIGHWRIQQANQLPVLMLFFSDNTKEQYQIKKLRSQQINLACKGIRDSIFKQLMSDGLIHQNMYSDPFHPVNNQWRIPPNKPETDSAIKQRVKDCIRFYALYYRDNIRRQKKTISFEGLPAIFEWYRRGIGLPDKAEVHKSWINCFYNKEQALKGYEILRDLIVRYEFDWPAGAPAWVYETHSVLEQMYHKLESQSTRTVHSK